MWRCRREGTARQVCLQRTEAGRLDLLQIRNIGVERPDARPKRRAENQDGIGSVPVDPPGLLHSSIAANNRATAVALSTSSVDSPFGSSASAQRNTPKQHNGADEQAGTATVRSLRNTGKYELK
jgi:hypothetical protein